MRINQARPLHFAELLVAAALIIGAAQRLPAQQTTDSLTLPQALSLAVERNPSVQEAASRRAGALAQEDIAAGGWYPTIGASVTYSRIGPVSRLFLPQFGEIELFPRNNFDARLGMRQLIFDFGRTHLAWSTAKFNSRAAEARVLGGKSAIAFRTVAAFYSVLFLLSNEEILDTQITILERHRQKTLEKVQTGTATNFEALTVTVRISEARNRKIEVTNGKKKNTDELFDLIGIDPRFRIPINGAFTASTDTPAVDSMIAIGMRQLPEIAAAKSEELGAQAAYQSALSSRYPLLSASAAAGFKNGYVPDINAVKFNWIVGATAEATIFSGFQIKNSIRQAQAAYQAAQAHGRDVERTATTSIMKAVADIEAAAAMIVPAQLQLQQAREAMVMAREQYDAGVKTNLDVLDAYASFLDATLNLLHARYTLELDRYGLKTAVGERYWER
jgi:outer membrane protein